MKLKFHYPLQKIVDLKENERTQAEWMLSDAMAELRTEEGMLRQLHSNKMQIVDRLNEASSQCAKIADLLVYQNYLNFVEQQIEKKDEDVKQAQIEVKDKKHMLNERMIQEKIWDKAKEKAYNIHRSHMLKKEQEASDELVTLRYLHQ